MKLFQVMIEATRAQRVEVFILGKKAMAEFEADCISYGMTKPPEPPPGAVRPPPWAQINGVPVLQSTSAAPGTVECLFRDPDGDLIKALMLTVEQFEDMVSEGEIDLGLRGPLSP